MHTAETPVSTLPTPVNASKKRVDFVCFPTRAPKSNLKKQSAFRILSLGVASNIYLRLQDDCWVEINLILVVLSTTQSLGLIVTAEKAQHVEVREVTLDAFQG